MSYDVGELRVVCECNVGRVAKHPSGEKDCLDMAHQRHAGFSTKAKRPGCGCLAPK